MTLASESPIDSHYFQNLKTKFFPQTEEILPRELHKPLYPEIPKTGFQNVLKVTSLCQYEKQKWLN